MRPTFANAYIVGMLASRDLSLYSNNFMLGSINTRSCDTSVMSRRWANDQTHQDGTGNVWRLVACTEEQRHQRIHHLLAEILRKPEHPEHGMDRYQGEGNFEFLYDFQHASEFCDVTLKLRRQGRRENIGPKVFAFAKTDPEGAVVPLSSIVVCI